MAGTGRGWGQGPWQSLDLNSHPLTLEPPSWPGDPRAQEKGERARQVRAHPPTHAPWQAQPHWKGNVKGIHGGRQEGKEVRRGR